MTSQTKEDALSSFKYINYNRIGVFVAMFFVDLYLFFGFICNYYGETEINNSLIWYYQLFFQIGILKDVFILKNIPILIIILIAIGFFITQREEISLKGIKLSLYFVPITLIFSIIWYWINVEVITVEPIVLLFGNIRGYITIVLTALLIMFGSFIGIKTKQYKLMKRKIIVPKGHTRE